MSRRSVTVFSAALGLAALATVPTQARTITQLDPQVRAPHPAAGRRLAQNYYYYPDGGNGYAYPPGYYDQQRPPQTDGWGWSGRGWGGRYSGGWNSGSGYAPQSGGAYQGSGGGYPPQGGYYGPPQGYGPSPGGGRGNRW